MIRSESNRFGKPLIVIYPGEHVASSEDCLLATVAASCLVVCLHDPVRRLGGMGHFIVPGAIGTEGIVADEVAAQGVASMERLIGEIVKAGGDRRSCRAWLFGAAGTGTKPVDETVIESNIRFLRDYFNLEKIQIKMQDLGGAFRRKIFFSPKTGTVFRKFLMHNGEHSEFARLEREYIASAFGGADRFGRVLLFD